MQKKIKRNIILQRFDYIREKNQDIYRKILNDKMEVDIKEALRMSIKDENN